MLKNNSRYVDVSGVQIISPMDAITTEDATKMIERAFESLRAHWHAESLVNPVLRKGLEKEHDETASQPHEKRNDIPS